MFLDLSEGGVWRNNQRFHLDRCIFFSSSV